MGNERKIYSQVTIMDKKIYALGFFDGVHLGHQALIREAVRMASEMDAQPAAITFDRHPQSLFNPNPPALLNTNTDRDALLRRFGIRHIHRLPVTQEIMSTSWQNFLALLLVDGTAGFVCGDDFRFGHKGEGNAETLSWFCAQRSIPCVIVPEQTMDGVRISSTHIRALIEAGEVEAAGRFLGHAHVLSGEVVSGRKLGRTIGIPTANLHLPDDVVCPGFGVYACKAMVEGNIYPAVTNVGVRPTVSGEGVTVEPWILDYSGDLYGREITLEFHHFLRPEQKFDSLEQLQTEIHKNAEQTRLLFR